MFPPHPREQCEIGPGRHGAVVLPLHLRLCCQCSEVLMERSCKESCAVLPLKEIQ